MPGAITIRFNEREFARQIRHFSDVEVKRAMAVALNKVAFEILEAEKQEVKRIFKFAGPTTENFLAGRGSFVFDGARPDKLVVTIRPREKSGAVLAEHAHGARLFASQKERLTFDGELAVPAGKFGRIRTSRGRVPKKLLPGTLLKRPGGRGYRAGKFIFSRASAKAESGLRFVLVPEAKLKASYDFYRVARQTAERVFAQKVKDAFAKIGRKA